MADLYSQADLGENIGPGTALSFKAQNAITKGQAVKLSTHTAGEIGSVDVAGAGDKAIGIALKDAAAGAYVAVLVQGGPVKVTAGGAVSIGSAVKAGATGKVVAAVRTVTIPSGATTVTSTSAQPSMNVEAGLAFALALQTTTADGDTFLILVGAAP